MPEEETKNFLDVDDLDTLSADDRLRYVDYWFTRTPQERFGEIMRLNIAKWGEEVFKKGMDTTKIRVVDLSKYRDSTV